MEQIARQSGFATKTAPGDNGVFQVINRIAVEELEAWFFGDVPALRRAFPRIPETLAQQSRYRDPDAISNGTWQALARLLVSYNYYSSSESVPKIAVARQISAHMQPDHNRSRSFQVFHEALRFLLTSP